MHLQISSIHLFRPGLLDFADNRFLNDIRSCYGDMNFQRGQPASVRSVVDQRSPDDPCFVQDEVLVDGLGSTW
ncbi:MAG: hypothetical protein CMJ81_02825 [Planctomycetaceae bacterium]|nr:hypothetical protein [Planctomycetaceae bacterium]MBP60779.1 hypothetical protein [Planctomycetaceae bacterium]